MPGYEVRIAEKSEQEAVLSTLLLAFSVDPCMRYALTSPETFIGAFRRLAMALGGAAFEHGSAYVGADGGAAALWLPAGVESDGEGIGALIEQLDIPPEKQEVLGQVGEAMGENHPHEPHWYLAMIGTDPSRQGRGLGSALLKEGLRRCDAEGLPAYLESSNPANIPLYERHGFEVVGMIQPGDFPPLVPMLRPARR
ncbi:N-acetyltransferase [Phenylobacterium sp.]|jgi:ribosomal protein S18 acetylase RimI-like enzyme|uniref:GNAT family N-acetyltransferase n=1 Tax=Phenylobacterium sp. TaxID=1871053 RepID=UPI002E321AAE|nr:N-acetyltransferase [Phenylobacterium sp.]HEX2559796.1 N-acetyltransferase [Phenylobacterium sp.]